MTGAATLVPKLQSRDQQMQDLSADFAVSDMDHQFRRERASAAAGRAREREFDDFCGSPYSS